jgi:hypothetical protein
MVVHLPYKKVVTSVSLVDGVNHPVCQPQHPKLRTSHYSELQVDEQEYFLSHAECPRPLLK